MASGTSQQQHQYQPQQQQQQPHHQPRQELPMSQHQNNNQMQYTTNHGLNACLDSQQPPTSMHQMSSMSPMAANSMALDPTQGHIMNISPHHQQQPPLPPPPQNPIISPVMRPAVLNQDMCNQTTNQHHMQHQKNQLLPALLSPQSTTGLDASDQAGQTRHNENDHDQIIDQVISLENDFSDPSSAMTNVDNDMGMMVNSSQPSQQQQQQQLQHHLGDTNFTSGPCMPGANNQLSSSSEDLLNLLLEFDRDPTSMISGQQVEQDERMGIETIRKQLMSCEVQSDQLQHNNSISPSMNQIITSSQPQQARAVQQSQLHQSHHGGIQQQQQQQHQLISRTAPVISHNQQPPHQLSAPGLSQQRQQAQHHRLSVDQSFLHGTYTNTQLGNTMPVSSSGQSYNPQSVSRISQSTPMSIDNNSPSPSWQQSQLSPYSPQASNNDPLRPPPQRQQHHPNHPIQPQQQQQHQAATTTSPHIQQLNQPPTQRRSPNQSISPPATTEPSPVVKKNPLLNAQLVNTRSPSITPTRFMNNSTSVLNQNPILNSKLSQNTFVASTVGSPVNPSLNPPQPQRYIQQQSPLHQQQSSSFSYDITQQQQQQNAQQHTPPQTGYMSMYGHGDHQQQPNQIFRTSNVSTTANSCIQSGGSPHMNMSSTSPSGAGGLSQQVKQEIRKKVQQPKQQHQTTSLLKQLLSDDNK